MLKNNFLLTLFCFNFIFGTVNASKYDILVQIKNTSVRSKNNPIKSIPDSILNIEYTIDSVDLDHIKSSVIEIIKSSFKQTIKIGKVRDLFDNSIIFLNAQFNFLQIQPIYIKSYGNVYASFEMEFTDESDMHYNKQQNNELNDCSCVIL